MAKINHTATAPNGQVFKRSSASRTYSHVVIGRRCKVHALAVAKSPDSAKFDGKNWDYYKSLSDGSYSHYDLNKNTFGIKDWPAYVAKNQERERQQGQEFIAQNPTREGYIAAQLADRIAKVEATDFTKFGYLGWTSRHDLALKLKAKEQKPYFAEVLILEATIA